MKKQNIWFVIVTYHSERTALRQLMAGFVGQTSIIIDNTNNNIGYGAAANQGLKKAFDAGACWVVVCNQDITITKPGIAHFIQVLEGCEPGVVGPEAGTLDPKRWTTVLNERRIEFHSDLYISGSMMAIHQAVWEKIGGFYEPYFLYYEDADLSVRAKKAGFPLHQAGIEGFRHGREKQENDERAGKEYYLARNHLLFVRRMAPVSVKVHEFLRLPKTIAEHHQNGNTEAIKGIGDFAIGRFGEEISQGQAFQKLRHGL